MVMSSIPLPFSLPFSFSISVSIFSLRFPLRRTPFFLSLSLSCTRVRVFVNKKTKGFQRIEISCDRIDLFSIFSVANTADVQKRTTMAGKTSPFDDQIDVSASTKDKKSYQVNLFLDLKQRSQIISQPIELIYLFLLLLLVLRILFSNHWPFDRCHSDFGKVSPNTHRGSVTSSDRIRVESSKEQVF